jgi:tetratricopeptide (TPR) repeat protein
MDKNKVIESASKLINKGQFEKAVKEYQRVLEIDPDDVRVLQKLAELYQKMNRKAEAADCFEKVAKTYAAQGFYLKAVALYKQVLKVIDRVEVNVRLAELYQQLGLVGDATKEWQTVSAYYDKIGDTKASLDTLKKLVDLDPDNVAARIRLGEQYARQDNLIEAVAELRRAAQYLQRNGRQDDYLRVAERISHLDQADTVLAKELAESYLSRGDSKRALAKLQICFKANPRDLSTLQMLARAFQELGQVSKTVSVLKELARVHLDAGRADDGRKTYVQAQELAPDDQEVKAALKALESAPRGEPAPPRPPTGKVQPAPQPPRPPTGKVQPPPQPPRPPQAPVAPARPPTQPQAVAPPVARPATAPIMGARPPTAPVAGPASTPPSPAAVPKLLKETEVYIKYGLHEKALEHLRKIFSADPDNLDAHEKAKVVALATGQTQDAIASLAKVIELSRKRGDPRVDAAREELRGLDPSHPAAAGGGAPAAAASLGDDEDAAIVDEAPMEVEPLAAMSGFESDEIVEEDIEHEVIEAEPEPAPAAPSEEEDEFASDIAEADFYIDAGLPEDARAILEAITLAAPDHPGASQRLRELPPKVITGPQRTAQAEPVAEVLHEDLAAELAAELAADVESDEPLDGDALDPFQVPAHEVLGEFRAKIQQTVRPEDVQTHYDLGIAYKEMGLLEEAVGEFELALLHGGGTRVADCIAMLGMCEMERGNAAEAIERFRKGLALPSLTAEAEKALAFELGAAHESLGNNAEALEQYELVGREDPKFRDVAERVARLGGSLEKPAEAVGKPVVKPAGTKTPAPVVPQKAAAQAAPSVAAQTNPQPENPGAARKNRKIGFV